MLLLRSITISLLDCGGGDILVPCASFSTPMMCTSLSRRDGYYSYRGKDPRFSRHNILNFPPWDFVSRHKFEVPAESLTLHKQQTKYLSRATRHAHKKKQKQNMKGPAFIIFISSMQYDTITTSTELVFGLHWPPLPPSASYLLHSAAIISIVIVIIKYLSHSQITMPPLLTFVARLSDGLPLVANTAPEFSSSVVITQDHKNQAKEILRGLGGTVRLVINFFCYSNGW